MPETEPLFKVRYDGRDYELSRLTIGDARALKRHFGVIMSETLSEHDPDYQAGMFYLCLIHDGMGHEDALAAVDEIDLLAMYEQIEEQATAALDEEEADEPVNPTVAARSSGSGKPKGSASGTTPRKPGKPRTPKS